MSRAAIASKGLSYAIRFVLLERFSEIEDGFNKNILLRLELVLIEKFPDIELGQWRGLLRLGLVLIGRFS